MLKHCTLKHTMLDKADSDDLLAKCTQLEFTNQMGGRKIAQFGNDYTYSGVKHKGQDMPEWMRELMGDIAQFADTEFNSVLVNWYPKGTAVGIGMHSDNETELGENPIVASVSLGESAIFKIVGKHDRIHAVLNHGAVLIMGKGCQQFYKHGIEKKLMESDRISLTFRNIKFG